MYSDPYIAQASLISDNELNERHALSAWLEGLREAEYVGIAGQPIAFNSYGRPDWQPAALSARRLVIFQSLTDPAYARNLIARYRPTHLVTSARQPNSSLRWQLIMQSGSIRLYHLEK
jgi:hypothetical protein